MIKSSFEIGPKSEKIRQKLCSPFSLVISPGDKCQIEKSQIKIEQYPRCHFCGSYASNFCIKNDNGWKCSICGQMNKTELPSNIPNSEVFEIDVDGKIGNEVTVIYLSLNFRKDDLDIIIKDLSVFINEMEERNLMFVLGCGEGQPLMFLCPYKFCFECNDGIVTPIQSNELIDYEKIKNLNAPIVRIFEKTKDLSKFIFNKEQFITIINTLSNITSMNSKYDCNEIYRVCELLTNQFQLSPIHFVSIIPGIDRKPYNLNKFYSSMIRIDILTPNLLNKTESTVINLPGLFNLFKKENLQRKLRYSLKEKVPYQLYMKFRVNDCKPSWKLNPYTVSIEDKNVLFAPVFINCSTPFVLDIHTNGSSDNIVIQIVSRIIIWNKTQKNYQNCLRIFNKKFKLSEDTKEILSTMNLNNLVWLWATRTLNNKPRDVVAGLYRSAASLLNIIDDDENENAKKLISISCTYNNNSTNCDNSDVRLQSRILLCNTIPDEYLFIPKYEQEKGIAICCDILYCEKENEETQKILTSNPMLNVVSPIPDWCKELNAKNLNFLNMLRAKI